MLRGNLLAILLLLTQSSCTVNPGSLSFLEPIAAPKPQAQADTYELKAELAPRTYVHSVFLQVFSLTEGTFPFEYNQLKNQFSDQSVLFNGEYGGGCDPYAQSEKPSGASFTAEYPDDACPNGMPNNLESPSSPSRFAVTNSVCNFLISRDSMTYTALRKVKPGWSNAITTDPTELDAISIYRLFLPDEVPEPEVLAELMKVAASGSTPPKRWKNLLYFVCILPDWQDIH